MAVRPQVSFSGGELTPALQEHVDLDKYRSGLKTARNIKITKTGTPISREGRFNFVATKLANRECLIFSPPNSGYLIEWGHLYVRTYTFDGHSVLFNFNGVQTQDVAHTLTETDLPNIHFTAGSTYIYVFCKGKQTLRYDFTTGTLDNSSVVFTAPANPVSTTVLAVGGPTGYDCDYLVTTVSMRNGVSEESFSTFVGTVKVPVDGGVATTVVVTGKTGLGVTNPIQMNVYRRPKNGGAFGYIGSSTYVDGSGAFNFTDIGSAADYTHTPPTIIYNGTLPANFDGKTGTIYQQRLITGLIADSEGIIASRPGLQNNFMKDYPLTDASALLFRAGSSGKAEILRFLDHDGLVIFTTVGVFLNTGLLGPSNLTCAKKGNWTIDEIVPPIGIPGGAIFVDLKTNSVRKLAYSLENAGYIGEELSIYSSHLLLGKRIVSWGFHEGDLACLYAVLDDGTFLSLNYIPEQQMMAWTRHDSAYPIEAVAETGYADKTFFLVNKNGQRYIECTVPRYISGATLAADAQAYMGHSFAAMDSMLSFETKLNNGLLGTDVLAVTPTDGVTWDGPLYLTCGGSQLFPAGGNGKVGTLLRFFDTDGSAVDLQVTARTNDNKVTVQPSCLFPQNNSTGIDVYLTATHLSGLDHLEGETVSVMVDGYVVGSPNNDKENYQQFVVHVGQLDLPFPGAIIHVGRPITYDVQTLDIDTVEQRPVLIESKTVNKVYVKVLNSRGLFCGNTFSNNDKVSTMEDLETMDVDYTQDIEILGNRFQAPYTKRYEITLPGDWASNGRVCLRQVDPLHFEILSILTDLDDQRR